MGLLYIQTQHTNNLKHTVNFWNGVPKKKQIFECIYSLSWLKRSIKKQEHFDAFLFRQTPFLLGVKYKKHDEMHFFIGNLIFSFYHCAK